MVLHHCRFIIVDDFTGGTLVGHTVASFVLRVMYRHGDFIEGCFGGTVTEALSNHINVFVCGVGEPQHRVGTEIRATLV